MALTLSLHDLNRAEARDAVRRAELLRFVDPITGRRVIVSGLAILRAIASSGVPRALSVVDLSVTQEEEAAEVEWAVAAVVAIRGLERVEDEPQACEDELVRLIRERWDSGESVPVPGAGWP